MTTSNSFHTAYTAGTCDFERRDKAMAGKEKIRNNVVKKYEAELNKSKDTPEKMLKSCISQRALLEPGHKKLIEFIRKDNALNDLWVEKEKAEEKLIIRGKSVYNGIYSTQQSIYNTARSALGNYKIAKSELGADRGYFMDTSKGQAYLKAACQLSMHEDDDTLYLMPENDRVIGKLDRRISKLELLISQRAATASTKAIVDAAKAEDDKKPDMLKAGYIPEKSWDDDESV
jgi:hypothetical protein